MYKNMNLIEQNNLKLSLKKNRVLSYNQYISLNEYTPTDDSKNEEYDIESIIKVQSVIRGWLVRHNMKLKRENSENEDVVYEEIDDGDIINKSRYELLMNNNEIIHKKISELLSEINELEKEIMKKDKEIISLNNEIMMKNNDKEMLRKEVENKNEMLEKEKNEKLKLKNELKEKEEIKEENESLRV